MTFAFNTPSLVRTPSDFMMNTLPSLPTEILTSWSVQWRQPKIQSTYSPPRKAVAQAISSNTTIPTLPPIAFLDRQLSDQHTPLCASHISSACSFSLINSVQCHPRKTFLLHITLLLRDFLQWSIMLRTFQSQCIRNHPSSLTTIFPSTGSTLHTNVQPISLPKRHVKWSVICGSQRRLLLNLTRLHHLLYSIGQIQRRPYNLSLRLPLFLSCKSYLRQHRSRSLLSCSHCITSTAWKNEIALLLHRLAVSSG